MTMQYRRAVVEDLHSLFHLGAMGAWTDGRLLTHFVTAPSGREAAFRVLLHRHGPMVLSVCRRVLGDPHAAEDAFQATFLVLVEKAGSVRGREVLGGWLYEVASRVSRKARSRAERRRVVEGQVESRQVGPGDDLDRAEVRSLIDEEIHRLPARYREPLLLCYSEGLRHHEIAERLDCPVGTVESRLSRARDRLRSQLARRGLASAVGLGLAALLPSRATAAVPAKLIEATARSAAGYASRRSLVEVAKAASVLGVSSGTKAGSALFSLLTCGGILLAGFGVVPAGPARPAPSKSKAPEMRNSLARVAVQAPVVAEGSPPRQAAPPTETPRPSRSSSAVAFPLSGITLDGRLDDWPSGLQRHPIDRQLVGHSAYDATPLIDSEADAPYFMAGYDKRGGRIYLAVVVPDDDPVARAGDSFGTDAVEVYVEGMMSDRRSRDGNLDASKMPVLQYVAVPGPVPAYNDPRGFNPSLMYGKLTNSTTKMAYRRDGRVTTYEWAVQVFDHHPDRPTKLVPGKRIGLDVIVVDKDRARKKPAWFYWGPPPTIFKGLDAGCLGELILADGL